MPFLAGKTHGAFTKHRNLQRFGGPNSLPQFLVLQLCGEDCDKQNVEFRFSLSIWTVGKNRVEILVFEWKSTS